MVEWVNGWRKGRRIRLELSVRFYLYGRETGRREEVGLRFAWGPFDTFKVQRCTAQSVVIYSLALCLDFVSLEVLVFPCDPSSFLAPGAILDGTGTDVTALLNLDFVKKR